jgi:hypothetical protein
MDRNPSTPLSTPFDSVLVDPFFTYVADLAHTPLNPRVSGWCCHSLCYGFVVVTEALGCPPGALLRPGVIGVTSALSPIRWSGYDHVSTASPCLGCCPLAMVRSLLPSNLRSTSPCSHLLSCPTHWAWLLGLGFPFRFCSLIFLTCALVLLLVISWIVRYLCMFVNI